MKPEKRNNSATPSVRNLFSDFFNDSDNFFSSSFLPSLMSSGRMMQDMPATNIRETEKTFEIEVAAPGMKKEDFNIDIENGMLLISAEQHSESKEEEKNYTRREFNYSSFQRSFRLPETVKEEDIKASYKDGVLQLSIPKKEESTKNNRRRINIS